ncbi:MAG TPA: hypothetical protein DDY31_10855 [Lachnospiraceae bacterium]|nr:hypothetical protein [Lachnospiraceae bacterium]
MKIIKGKIPGAKKIVIYGPEGIGKSTFASKFPEPVFIDTEGSTKDMDVSRFEKASSWTMLLEQVRYVKQNPSVCRTLVIDTADWAEQMCVADVCARHGKKGVEDFGYGNGYVYAKEEWGRFLNALEEVREAGIHVVLTAHASLRKFEQPDEMGSYDRWELKIGKKTSSQTAPLLKEWADMVLFANYKTWSIATDEKGKKRKAQGGSRVMYTAHNPCWDAKNRYGLPEEVPFDYVSIKHIIEPEKSSQLPAGEKKIEELRRGMDNASAPTQPVDTTGTMEEAVQQTMNLETQQESTSSGQEEENIWVPDERIPKALRDLMIANHVCEWDIQNVCEAKGYVPAGTPLYEYEEVSPGFTDGVLVGAWPQVYGAIREMKEKEEVPFN